jgi:hypothetical protein
METKLEQIAVKARREPNLRFTSLAHHITRDRVQKNLLQIPKRSAAGVDGTDGGGGEGELRRMDRADAPIHPPAGISGAEHSACLYPQARYRSAKQPILAACQPSGFVFCAGRHRRQAFRAKTHQASCLSPSIGLRYRTSSIGRSSTPARSLRANESAPQPIGACQPLRGLCSKASRRP